MSATRSLPGEPAPPWPPQRALQHAARVSVTCCRPACGLWDDSFPDLRRSQKPVLNAVINEALLDSVTYPGFITLGQHLRSSFRYSRDIAPQGITDRPQLIRINLFAVSKISTVLAEHCQRLHAGWCIRFIIPCSQVILTLAPFAFKTCPFTDGFSEGTDIFQAVFVTLISFCHSCWSLI